MDAPVFHIPLTDGELKMIGEIAAIQGQIDFLMQQIVRALLLTSEETAQAILGASGIKTNADVWIRIVRDKVTVPVVLNAAERVFKDIGSLAEGRNDFVHAFFAESVGEGFGLTGGGSYLKPRITKPVVAVRTRNRKQRTAKDIQKVRDAAASISHRLFGLNNSIQMGLAT